MKPIALSQIMTQQVHYLNLEDDLLDAKNMMDKYSINHVPVLDDGKIVGILSKNDLNQVEFLSDFVGNKLEENTLHEALSIEELMSKNVISLPPESSILVAIDIFSNECIQCIPILDNERLVGMITTKDLFHHIIMHEMVA